jgi:hypothetical protein
MTQALRDKEGYYRVGGERWASVTTILGKTLSKRGLDGWKDRTPDWPTQLRHAAIYGTFMHLQIQSEIAEIPPDIPSNMPIDEWPKDLREELEGRMEQWDKLDLKITRPNLIEHTITISEAKSAGTLDYFGPIDNMKTLMDFKSSKKAYESHKIQMGAYYLGLLAEGKEPEWGIIAYVRKTSAELVELTPEELASYGLKFIGLAEQFYMNDTN